MFYQKYNRFFGCYEGDSGVRRRYVGFWVLIAIWFFATLIGIGSTTWFSEKKNAEKYIAGTVNQYAYLISEQLQLDQRTLANTGKELSMYGLKNAHFIHQTLVDLQSSYHHSIAVAILNAQGQIFEQTGTPFSLTVLHSSAVTQATKAAYQRIFQSHRFGIGPPIPNSHFSGQVMSVELYPLTTFPGHWLALAHPAVFSVVPPDQLMYKGTAIAILRSDGLLQSRYPYPVVTSYGYEQSGVMMQYLKAHPDVKMGLLTGKVTADNETRITAFKQVQGNDLYVGVGVPLRSIVAVWLSNYIPFAGTSIVLILLAGLIFLIESRHIRRAERAEAVAKIFYSILARLGELKQQNISEDEFIEKSLEVFIDNSEFAAAVLGTFHESAFSHRAIAGISEEQLVELLSVTSGHILESAWESGEVAALDKLPETALQVKSMMVMPIQKNGKTLFILMLISNHATIKDKVYQQFSNRVVGFIQRILENFELQNREREAHSLAERMQALYQVLSMVGEVAQQAVGEQELFQLICDTLVAKNVFSGAWIGAPDTSGRFQYYASAGLGMKEYLEQIDIRADASQAGQGPAGRTWRTGKLQVENDWENSDIMDYWLETAQYTGGWKMSADYPVFRGSKIFAVLTVYHKKSFTFDENLAQLGSRIAELIGQLLTNRDLTDDLNRLNNQYNLLLESMAEGVVGLDLTGTILFSNASAEQLLGYAKEEMIGKDQHALFHHHYEDGAIYPASECLIIKSVDQQTGFHHDQEVFWRKNGSCFPVDYTVEPILAGQGEVNGAVLTFQDITMRKRADEALQSGAEFRRALIDNSPVGIFLASTERVIVQVNRRVCEMLGYAKDELVGQNFRMIHDSNESYEGFREQYHLLRVSAYGLINLEYPFKKKDGTVLLCAVSGTPLDSDNLSKGIIWTLQDITQRKIAEAKLQESEEMLRAIYEVLPVGISITDPMGNLVDCNIEAARLLGISSEEHNSRNFTGENWTILRTDGTVMPASEYASVRALQEHQMIHNVEMEVLTPGGSIWLSVSAIPVDNPKYGVTIAYEDITTRKKAELEMLKLTKAVEFSPVSIVITDALGNMEYVNPRFTEVTGYTPEEALGKNQRILKSGYVPSEVYEKLWTTIMEGKTWRGELLNQKKNGDLVWEMVRISPFKDMQERITHFVAVKEDITAQKMAQEELKKAKEEAESASHVKGEFLANMSHEIRTPMNAILGLTQLLLNTELVPKQLDYLEKVYTSSQALLRLLNDILDYSKIEAGRMEVENNPYQIEEVLQNVLKLFSAKIEEKGLKPFIELSPGVPELVMGDSLRVTQVLNNLVGNAIKFTDKGEIRILVDVVNRNEEDWLLRFTVRDTGIGIAIDKLENLFQAFTQADNSISRKYGGTGLGLAISQQLVELMGGEISVSSIMGQGSIFSFTIHVGVVSSSPDFELQDLRRFNHPNMLTSCKSRAVSETFEQTVSENDLALFTQLFNDLLPYLEEQEMIPDAIMDDLLVWSKKNIHPELFNRLLSQIDQFDQSGAKITLNEVAYCLSLDREDR